MKRSFHACWILLFATSATIAAAQESSPAPTRSVSDDAAYRAIGVETSKCVCTCERSHGLEATLHEPAALEFSSDKPVTVGDILDQLHRQHGLSIRFDVPTFSALYGIGPSTTQHMNIGVGRTEDFSLSATTAGETLHPPKYIAPGSAAATSPDSPATTRPVSSRRTPEPVVRAQAPAGAKAPPQPLESQANHNETATNPGAAVKPASGAYPPPAAEQPIDRRIRDLLPQGTEAEVNNEKLPPAKPEPQLCPDHNRSEPGCEAPETFQSFLDQALKTEVDVRQVDLQSVSVATALRVALEALPAADIDDDTSGLPIPLTEAAQFDYLVEHDAVLITTRLKALTHKETRVYSVKHLKDFSATQLATVIRQSVRPWSWRSRIDEMGDQLRAGTAHIPAKTLGSVLKAGYQMAADATGVSLATDQSEEKSDAKKSGELSDAEQAEMLGNAVINSVVTLAHTTLTALEIAHYADPPTGSIQTLPGKLIITQSQAAHREIADLLKQLGEE